MKRIVILGGTGFFGSLIAERLRAAGLQPIVASRTNGDIVIDADKPQDLKATLKQRDLVIDAAGPFQKRTPALIEAARTMGFDVIDLSDSPQYTSMIHEHAAPIGAAGIRVLTACSSLSTVSAAVLKNAAVDSPRRLTAYLLPASRYTANRGTVESVLSSTDGALRTIRFPDPLGTRTGVMVKSVDAVTLPRVYSTLRSIELIVDLQMPGANLLFGLKPVRRLIERFQSRVLGIVRRIGPTTGVLAYEIALPIGHKHRIFFGEKSFMLAVLPAVLAATSIAGGHFPHRGVVPPTEHVDPKALLDAIQAEGITVM